MRTSIIIVISVISALFIGEIYLRSCIREPVSLYMPSSNESLVYELNPDYPEINNSSMRNRSFDKAYLEGKYVIAVIGDSHTFCSNVKDMQDTYPSKLELYLNRLSKEERYAVLNFGVPGYNTAQELEVLKEKALLYNPNLIILQVAINDTHVCNYIQPKNKLLNRLIHRSRILVWLCKTLLYRIIAHIMPLYDWAGKHFPDALLFQEGLVGTLTGDSKEDPSHSCHPARTPERVPSRYHYMLGEENWKRHIHKFAALTKGYKIKVLATGFISGEQRGFLLMEDFDIYDFNEIFEAVDKSLYGYNPALTSSHFNARRCDVTGKRLAQFIHKKYLTD